MSETASVAKGHINALEEELKSDDYRGPEWDMHKQLLRAAHNTTNGGSGDLRVLSENLGMLTATYVQDKIRMKDEMREAFQEMHADICLFTPMIKTGEDGKKIMPWDQGAAKKTWRTSSMSFEVGGKKVNLAGPVTFVFCLLLFVFGLKWLGTDLAASTKASVGAIVKAELSKAVSKIEASEAALNPPSPSE